MKTKQQKQKDKQRKLSSKWCNTNVKRWVFENSIESLEDLRKHYPYLTEEEFQAVPAYWYIKQFVARRN